MFKNERKLVGGFLSFTTICLFLFIAKWIEMCSNQSQLVSYRGALHIHRNSLYYYYCFSLNVQMVYNASKPLTDFKKHVKCICISNVCVTLHDVQNSIENVNSR